MASVDDLPATPEAAASETSVDLTSAHDHPIRTPILMGLLERNVNASWTQTQRVRNPKLWGFFCATDPSKTQEERSKSSDITCLLCHAMYHKELHPSYPRQGAYMALPSELDVASWAPLNSDDIPPPQRAKYKFVYHSNNGCASLKKHLESNHPEASPNQYPLILMTLLSFHAQADGLD